ncbi:MAG TPA: hypothetical protein VLC07_06040, partial [Solirubrobacterales bacterium]|nr:hypothetical protein [Solirubrobacterales bacterium]
QSQQKRYRAANASSHPPQKSTPAITVDKTITENETILALTDVTQKQLSSTSTPLSQISPSRPAATKVVRPTLSPELR